MQASPPPRLSAGPLPAVMARDWLVRLRWAALGGQLATIGFAAFALSYPVAAAPVVAVLILTALSNLVLARSAQPAAVPAALLFDLIGLTALLAATGGASNPFSVLYLVHVALAAVLLGPGWTWRIALAAVGGFAALFPFTDPHAMHAGLVEAHLGGMWVAFGVTAAGIAWFVARLARDVRERDERLAALQQQHEREERVIALATLAAGAAHELGSPLSAIAVGAREIALLAGPDSPEILEEAEALRAQVERCRDIVARLTQRAGASQGDGLARVHLDALEGALRGRLTASELSRVELDLPAELVVFAPLHALAEALASLVQNALLAGPGPVRVRARQAGERVTLRVEDEGVGMAPEVLLHLGEPFFTTRPAGQGMGLGVFLARRLTESLGGNIRYTSKTGQGTAAELELPGGLT